MKPITVRKNSFNETCTELYLFHPINDGAVCLICDTHVSCARKHVIDRHFHAMHSQFDSKFKPQSSSRIEMIDHLIAKKLFSGSSGINSENIASPPKSKIRKYSFKNEWVNSYLVYPSNGGAVCLLCNNHLSCLRKYTIERHYRTHHSEFDSKFAVGSSSRSEVVNVLLEKSGYQTKESSVRSCNLDHITSSRIAFYIAYDIAKKTESYCASQRFADRLKTVLSLMYKDTAEESEIMNFVAHLPLSRRSVTRRIELISQNLRERFILSLRKCCGFSIQLDGSTDIKSVEQVTVFIRAVHTDFSMKETLFACMPLHKSANAVPIYNALKEQLIAHKIPLEKLVSITTHGAATMVGRNNGVITLLKKDRDFPNFLSFHCVIHQLALCAKSLKIVGIVELVSKIINSIIARPLQHRLYREHIKSFNIEHDLIYYTEVRWLSKGLMLERFYEHLTAVVSFLDSRNEKYSELTDADWLIKFAYLTDIMQIINQVNTDMQGNQKYIGQFFEYIDRLKECMNCAIEYFETNKAPPMFPRLVKLTGELKYSSLAQLLHYTKTFLREIDERFVDFSDVRIVVNYLTNPFDNSIRISEILPIIKKLHPVDDYELSQETINLKVARCLKGLQVDAEFWKKVPSSAYPNLQNIYLRTCSYFGSTYLCESTFSSMKHVKSCERSRITDSHLLDVLSIATSDFEPDFETLAQSCKEETQQIK